MQLTPRLGLRRPDGTDPFLRQDFVTNYNTLDQYPGTLIVPNIGARPTSWGANQVGMSVWQQDTRQEWRFMGGTEWHLVNPVERLPGEITMYVSGLLPSGWLLCDGTDKPRASYPSLASVLGLTYGSPPDPATFFRLPDMKLRMPVGAGAGRAVGLSEGSAEGSRNARWSHLHGHSASATVNGAGTGISVGIDATNTNHNHAISFDHPVATNTQAGGTGSFNRVTSGSHGSTDTAAQPQGVQHAHTNTVSDPSHAHGASASVGDGSSVDHPFLVVNFLIKT